MCKEIDFFEIGIIAGINFAIYDSFDRLMERLSAELISKHNALAAVSEDIEAIKNMITTQRQHIEKIVDEARTKEYCENENFSHAENDTPTKDFKEEKDGHHRRTVSTTSEK